MAVQYEPLTRSVPVLDLEMRDGVLDAIFVPWDVSTRVFDPFEDEPYDEGFRRGAFDVQLQRPSFSAREIPLLPRHGSSETFGHTRSIENADKGLHGVVAIRPSLREDVQQMVDDGIDSVSIEFLPLQKRARHSPDGVRWRDAAVLTAVAMTSSPAYVDAKVLAFRAEHELDELQREQRRVELQREIDELRAGADRWRSA